MDCEKRWDMILSVRDDSEVWARAESRKVGAAAAAEVRDVDRGSSGPVPCPS